MSGLTVKKVHIGNHEAKQVYFEAFPKNERMPYLLMILMSKLWNTDYLIFYDGATPVGIMYLAKNFRCIYIPERRGSVSYCHRQAKHGHRQPFGEPWAMAAGNKQEQFFAPYRYLPGSIYLLKKEKKSSI